MNVVFSEEEVIALVEAEFKRRFPDYEYEEIRSVVLYLENKKMIISESPNVSFEVFEIRLLNEDDLSYEDE